VPPDWLTWAVLLHSRAGATHEMLQAADLLARQKKHADPHTAFQALREAAHEGLLAGHVEEAMALWDVVPADADIQPSAVHYQAELLLWQTADFPKAVRVLEPLAQIPTDVKARRLYGDALVLDQQVERGRKILQQLPIDGPPEKQAAISGAMAFTVEDYLKTGDWESAQEAWERWQAKYPAEFLEGYSALLETKLMELKKSPEAAARLAEAFASALPHSSYAPQLLDRASKLLAKSNPDKSNALRLTLKERYPEDPLSQDAPK
jgi:tetratricopeptide (TPR) repeat protein